MSWSMNVDAIASTSTEVTMNLVMLPPPPPPSTEPYSTGMMAGGIVSIVLGSLGIPGGLILYAIVASEAERGEGPGLATMVGSGVLLIGGIVLTAVGAHKVPVERAMRSHHPRVAITPSRTGIEVSF